jgi:hypothetical protein
MRLYYAVAVCLAWGLVTGCNEPQAAKQTDGNLDVELVKTLNNIGVENAIINQRTLFPYHFVTGSEKLNDLGQRELAVLARHFAEYPGTLSVRRGPVTGDLYRIRLTSVMNGLKDAGVDMARMQLSDSMPGGTGMPCEQVVVILERAATDCRAPAASGGTGRITR